MKNSHSVVSPPGLPRRMGTLGGLLYCATALLVPLALTGCNKANNEPVADAPPEPRTPNSSPGKVSTPGRPAGMSGSPGSSPGGSPGSMPGGMRGGPPSGFSGGPPRPQ